MNVDRYVIFVLLVIYEKVKQWISSLGCSNFYRLFGHRLENVSLVALIYHWLAPETISVQLIQARKWNSVTCDFLESLTNSFNTT